MPTKPHLSSKFPQKKKDLTSSVSGIAITTDNNIVVCGVFHSIGYFGGERFYATSHPKARFPLANIFVATYTTHGDHMWSIGLGGQHEDIANGLALDKQDNIFVAATFGSKDFVLNGAVLPAPQGRDCLLMKFHLDGSYEWHKQFGSRGTDTLKAIAIDSQGNIILAGEVGGNVTIDDNLIPAQSYLNLLVLKLSKEGNFLWGQTFAAGFVVTRKVMVNFQTDQIIVLGNYNSESFVIGQNSLPASSSDCLFVAEWSKNGDILTSQGLCGNGTVHTESGAVDQKSGKVLIGCDSFGSEKSQISIFQQLAATPVSQTSGKKDEL